MNEFIYKASIPLTYDVQICTLLGFEHIRPCYWLTSYNLIYDIDMQRYPVIGISNVGYPYVGLRTNVVNKHAFNALLHRVIALARIANQSHEVVEHLDDNPLNLRVSNLKLSTSRENSLRAFANSRRCCPEATFVAALADGTVHVGTMSELAMCTGIPLGTLYDRYYKGPINPDLMSRSCLSRNKINAVIKIKDPPPMEYHRHRLIDYRKEYGNSIPLCLDLLDVIIT